MEEEEKPQKKYNKELMKRNQRAERHRKAREVMRRLNKRIKNQIGYECLGHPRKKCTNVRQD